MKMNKMMLALGVVMLAGQAPLALAQKCDDERQVCRDKSGPNVEQTRQRYGDDAARRLERRQSRDDGGAQAGGGGRPGGGQNAGGNQGGRPGAGQPPGAAQPPGQGQNLGGNQGGGRPNPGQNLGGGGGAQADTFSPGPGISCVRSAQVCYSAGAPNPFHTAKHFGPGAANRIGQ